MDYGHEHRDARIAEIGQLILASPQNREDALRMLKELRVENDRSFNNYAGLLAEYLMNTSPAVMAKKPWVQEFIDEIIAQGVKVRPTRHAYAG